MSCFEMIFHLPVKLNISASRQEVINYICSLKRKELLKKATLTAERDFTAVANFLREQFYDCRVQCRFILLPTWRQEQESKGEH